MSLPVRFVQSEYWNTGSSGSIGGTGVDTGLGTSLNDVFPLGAVSDFVGQPARHRFQKVFIENTGDASIQNITNAKVFFNDLKFADQISFAFATGAADTGDHPTGFPVGYTTGDFQTPQGILNAVAVPLTGIDTGTLVGVWLHQEISAGLPAETGASATLGLIGEVG